MGRKLPSKRRAFMERAATSESHTCWTWPFAVRKSSGYGAADVWVDSKKKNADAHRLMCEMAHGPAPEDKPFAAHSCGNCLCVNPNHLSWATREKNTEDSKQHGVLCGNKGRRLTPAARRDIQTSPASLVVMAEKYGIRPDYAGVVRRAGQR